MARVLFLLISTHPARTRQEELRLRAHLHITEVEQLRSVHKEDASARGSEQWERQIKGDGMAESWLRELEGQQGAGRGAPCTDHSSKPLPASRRASTPKKQLGPEPWDLQSRPVPGPDEEEPPTATAELIFILLLM